MAARPRSARRNSPSRRASWSRSEEEAAEDFEEGGFYPQEKHVVTSPYGTSEWQVDVDDPHPYGSDYYESEPYDPSSIGSWVRDNTLPELQSSQRPPQLFQQHSVSDRFGAYDEPSRVRRPRSASPRGSARRTPPYISGDHWGAGGGGGRDRPIPYY